MVRPAICQAVDRSRGAVLRKENTMLYTDAMLAEVSEPANRLVTDGKYINLLIVQDIRDAYEEALGRQETLARMENNAALILAEQPDEKVAEFLSELSIEMLDGLLGGVGRLELLIQRTLSAKRHALTPRSPTIDPDDLGDDIDRTGT